MKSRRIWSVLGSLGLVGVMVAGVMALSSGPTVAAPVRPDCGPSYLWDCTLPNGTHKLVGGTRCEIATYKRQTGATCVPSDL